MTEIVNEAYAVLRSLGIVQSQSDFSLRWLGRSASYVRTMKALRREIAIEPMAVLAFRLRALRNHLAASEVRPFIERACDEIRKLETRLWAALHDRCAV